MKTKALLLIACFALDTAILFSQQAPQVIPAGKPIIIPVPKKKYSLTLMNTGKNGAIRKTLEMTPPQTIPFLSGADVKGLALFTTYNTEQGLALNSIACGYTDKKGNLWFGTLGGGVSRYDGKSFTSFTASQGLANNIIYSIVEDKTGNIWFGTSGGGVSRYDGKSFTNLLQPRDWQIIQCGALCKIKQGISGLAHQAEE